jgi:thiamine pyrophosphokinase
MAPTTIIRFAGGGTVRVDMDLSRVHELLQRALADNVLLELESPDGRIVVINPQQVQILEPAEDKS